MEHMIEMRRVSKFYSNRDTVSTGFSKVDLNLDMGEFVVITGESGGGKSTLLNVISGLDSYEEGEMFVAGQDTSSFRTEDYERYRKAYIGNIFQDYNLVNSYTVYQNVELVMLLNGKKRKNMKQRIMRILEHVGLRKYARTKVSKLSGGQKQRVAIARAFAKDAPIIVADEPTGNLDTESAKSVMETLYRISKHRLVIIVTHNYEQAAPYATRKIQMRDGRILEDERLRPTEITASTEELENQFAARMRSKENRLREGAKIRLGLRNTFNIKMKFLLLLIIYLFISLAVICLYSSTMESEHQSDLLGGSEYFFDTSAERIILHKDDLSAFTKDDYKTVESIENVDYIVKNDLALDRTVYFESEELYMEGPVYRVASLKESDLAYGRLPKKESEVVLGINDMSDSYTDIQEMGDGIIGKKYYITSNSFGSGEGGRILEKKCTIVGVVYTESGQNTMQDAYGYCQIYMRDKLANRILISTVASSSQHTFKFGETTVSRNEGGSVISSSKVPEGKTYILSSDAESYYKDGKAVGYNVEVEVKNQYFESSKKFTVDAIITEKNITDLLGYSKEDYENYYSTIFINPEDYKDLYDKGNYQISAFMKNESKSEATVQALQDAGYDPLAMKTILEDANESYDLINKIVNRVVLVILFLVLFFISYAVIRLIMRSRNTYYTTLRILGASKGNTSSLLRIELLAVMCISVIIVIGFILAMQQGLISVPQLEDYIAYVKPRDYGILFLIMIIMSLMIAQRYSSKIFGKSAMTAYRGEA